ncbi:MAG: hypothetical protein WAV45_00930 [Propionibacteriaceae bacterium]|nr:hypothetical protein [Micropruina sp.]HBX80495.1 hypothetical protein [Propionibacteriaceae bacterium]HBY23046.1 hypothetical protein [Propionibacteriaceae bacterium]
MSGTAEVHTGSTLTPSKLDLLAAWLPTRDWFEGDATQLERVAAYRFVDPDGEVGLETILVRAGDAVYQVPLTYHSEELEDGRLVGVMDHSVLGTRYAYDATSDPLYMAELIRVIREADGEAEVVSADGVAIPASMRILGSGTALVANAAGQTVRLARRLDDAHALDTNRAIGLLTGTWTLDGVDHETVLAVLR